jgi:hypothetical protein
VWHAKSSRQNRTTYWDLFLGHRQRGLYGARVSHLVVSRTHAASVAVVAVGILLGGCVDGLPSGRKPQILKETDTIPPGATMQYSFDLQGEVSVEVHDVTGPVRVTLKGPGGTANAPDVLVREAGFLVTTAGRWTLEVRCASTWHECKAAHTVTNPPAIDDEYVRANTAPATERRAVWENKQETFPGSRGYVQLVDLADATQITLKGSSSGPLDVCIVPGDQAQAFADGRSVTAFECATGATAFNLDRLIAGGQRIGAGARCQIGSTCVVTWTLALTAY